MKLLLAWLAMLVLSIANGTVRDFTYGQRMGLLAAHQLSTFTGAVLVGGVMWVASARFASMQHAVVAGAAWLALTVAFEFLFFHYVGGHSWSQLLANYDLSEGRLWPLLLLWIAAAPPLFFWLRQGRA